MGWIGSLFKRTPDKQEDPIPFLSEKTEFKGVVLGAVLVDGGTGYSDATGLATVGGSGAQQGFLNCKVDITTTDGVVSQIIINSGGLGYTLNDVLIVRGGNNNCTFKANPVST